MPGSSISRALCAEQVALFDIKELSFRGDVVINVSNSRQALVGEGDVSYTLTFCDPVEILYAF